jgi:hypothetical protein
MPQSQAAAERAEAATNSPSIIHRPRSPELLPIQAEIAAVPPGERETPQTCRLPSATRTTFVVESPPPTAAPVRSKTATEAAPPQPAPSSGSTLRTQARPEPASALPSARPAFPTTPPPPLVRAALQPAPSPPPAARLREPPQSAIRIGSIEVQILPSAAPPPVVPPAPKPQSAVSLARGFTSSFGLRQG